jgi:hypothetical protein
LITINLKKNLIYKNHQKPSIFNKFLIYALNKEQPNNLEGESDMADKNTMIEQMLEHLVNDEKSKAEELFHEYVVSKSREIYETMIESEIRDDENKDDEFDEDFDEIAIEADNEMDLDTEDPTDDLASELDSGEDEEMGEKSEEELFQDLDAIVDELQVKFDQLKGKEGSDMDMDMNDEKIKDDFELETVREYVEKVPAAKMGDNGVNTKSIVAGKNDMGGTTANIVRGGETKNEGTKGGLANPKPQDMKSGNINVPGGKAGSAFSKKEPGHGAEKKGTGESADNTASLFRGRR